MSAAGDLPSCPEFIAACGRGDVFQRAPRHLAPDGFTPLVIDADYRAAFYRVLERCEELKTSVAEHQWNALEMARKADLAERRAEDAEAAIEATRDLLDGWEHDGPDDPAVRLLIQRVREMLALVDRFREARDGTGHE